MAHTIIYANFDVMMQGLLGFFKGTWHCAPLALKDSIMYDTLVILVLVYIFR